VFKIMQEGTGLRTPFVQNGGYAPGAGVFWRKTAIMIHGLLYANHDQGNGKS
jgi:hypothetical protein